MLRYVWKQNTWENRQNVNLVRDMEKGSLRILLQKEPLSGFSLVVKKPAYFLEIPRSILGLVDFFSYCFYFFKKILLWLPLGSARTAHRTCSCEHIGQNHVRKNKKTAILRASLVRTAK